MLAFLGFIFVTWTLLFRRKLIVPSLVLALTGGPARLVILMVTVPPYIYLRWAPARQRGDRGSVAFHPIGFVTGTAKYLAWWTILLLARLLAASPLVGYGACASTTKTRISNSLVNVQ